MQEELSFTDLLDKVITGEQLNVSCYENGKLNKRKITEASVKEVSVAVDYIIKNTDSIKEKYELICEIEAIKEIAYSQLATVRLDFANIKAPRSVKAMMQQFNLQAFSKMSEEDFNKFLRLCEVIERKEEEKKSVNTDKFTYEVSEKLISEQDELLSKIQDLHDEFQETPEGKKIGRLGDKIQVIIKVVERLTEKINRIEIEISLLKMGYLNNVYAIEQQRKHVNKKIRKDELTEQKQFIEDRRKKINRLNTSLNDLAQSLSKLLDN